MINTYKVSISVGEKQVIFEASTPIGESRSANYQGHNILHLPTDILAYQSTSSRHFSIAGKLVSRNSDEAAANALSVDLIRSWILPDFGKSGATPPIVKLKAFNNNNINNVQCVIKSYSINYPDDIDWIYRADIPMPVICMLSIELEEVYTPQQITNGKWRINLSKGGTFVNGNLFDDFTASSGGKYVFSTPSVVNLANSKGFTGIATSDLSGYKSVEVAKPFSNGNFTSTLGVTPSPLITAPKNTTPAIPIKSGFNQDSVATLTTVTTTTQSSGQLSYSAKGGFKNIKPTNPT